VTHILHPEQGSSNPDWLPVAGGPTHTHCIDRHIINQPKMEIISIKPKREKRKEKKQITKNKSKIKKV